MESKNLYIFSTIMLLSSCASLNESMQLGAGMGLATGAAAIAAGSAASGKGASFENVAVGAGIGLGLGLLTSYIVHKSVEDKREAFQSEDTEMHFGDLPPSPFITPKIKLKKGVAR